MMSARRLLSAVLLILLTACSAFSTPAPGEVLFQDDFSSQAHGWRLRDDLTGSAGVSGGEMVIAVHVPETSIVTTAGLDLTDVQIELTARKLPGPDDNSFGIVCRYQDEDNFYFFQVSSDGYFALGKVIGGSASLFGSDQMQPSPFLLLGENTNILRFDCRGRQLSAYINNELAAVYEDEALQSGDVGLIAGTIENPGVEIGFDLFSVRNP